MAGAVLAVIGVVVLVVALIALRSPTRNGTSPGTRTVTQSVTATAPGPSGSAGTSKSATSKPPTSASSSAAGLTGALPLVVLNDTSTSNLATVAADRFRSGGWTVTSVDENYSNNILSTAAYYDPSVAKAKAAAEALQQQFSAIQRVVPKFTGLPDGPIVVVLTADYTSG